MEAGSYPRKPLKIICLLPTPDFLAIWASTRPWERANAQGCTFGAGTGAKDEALAGGEGLSNSCSTVASCFRLPCVVCRAGNDTAATVR